MTAYPGIAPPLYPHDCLVALVLSLRTLWETALGGVLFSPSMISICQEQDCPRQHLLAVWTFFIRPRAFLPPRCRPWAWYGMGRGCQILWPHNSPSKSCYPTPRSGSRILMSSGLCHSWSSLVPLSARASSPAQGMLLEFRCTRRVVINTFMEWRGSLRYTRHAFIGAFMKRRGSSGWGFPWKLGGTYFACNSLFELRVK